MAEFCPLCKMEVESLRIHWKFNHKKLKMSKKNKKGQVGWMDKRQKGLSATTDQKKYELHEEELRTCSQCGEKNILNMDQHVLLKHRTKKPVPTVAPSREDAAERVRKKLEVFRTQRKFESALSDINNMRQNGEERVKLEKEVISGICSDNTIPQLVVCPFCKKTIFYGLITSRYLADKIKGPVRNHLEKCDPVLDEDRSPESSPKNKENPASVNIKAEVDWKTITNRPKKGVRYVVIDGKKIPAAVYPACDGLGNPLDLNLPGSQRVLKLPFDDADFSLANPEKMECSSSAVVFPLSLNMPCIKVESNETDVKVESNDTDVNVKLEPDDRLVIDMPETSDIKKEIFADVIPQCSSSNVTDMTDTVLEQESSQSSSVESETSQKIIGIAVRKDLLCST